MGKRKTKAADYKPDTDPPGEMPLRGKLDRRFNEAWAVADTFRPRWRALGEYLAPTRPAFAAQDHNKGNRSNDKIIDSTALQAAEIAKTGLLQGMASPSRPWFTVDTPSGISRYDRMAYGWLQSYRDAILNTMDRSNFYTSLGVLLDDEVKFGTGTMAIFEDDNKVIRCQTFPIGSYALSQNDRGRVDTFCRRIVMSARQAASKFGREKLSQKVQQMLESGRVESAVAVRHMIAPNESFAEGTIGPGGRRFREWYWEESELARSGRTDEVRYGGQGGMAFDAPVLQEGGYSEFPIIAGRWDKNDDDVWGTSYPGIVSLGDNMMLQQMSRKFLNALEKMINPPLLVDPALDNKTVSLLAGSRTSGPTNQGGQSVRPIHELRYPLQESEYAMEQVRVRIRKAFMEPLFLMLIGDARSTPPTAEEIRAREREKASILGPINERHSDDVFDPAIERIAAIMLRRSQRDWVQNQPGMIPPPPPSLRKQELRVEYISEVAQSQRLAGLSGIERHVQFVGGIATVAPQALDVVDWDEVVRESGRVSGIPAQLNRDDEFVQAIRKQRQQAQQQAQMAQSVPAMAGAAKDLAATDGSGKTTVDRLKGAIG